MSDHQTININNIIFILSAASMLFSIVEESLQESSEKEIIITFTDIN